MEHRVYLSPLHSSGDDMVEGGMLHVPVLCAMLQLVVPAHHEFLKTLK